MTQPVNRVAAEVASRAKGLRDYVGRMERLFVAGALSLPDLHRVHAGAFISFHTYLERSLERTFLGLLMYRLTSSDRLVRPLVEIKSETVAHAIVRGGQNYVDWLPYERHTMKRAKAFFSGGRPFADLGAAERRALQRTTTMRNAIAHESSQSLRQFKNTFVVGKTLPPDQQKPTGYLQGQHAIGQSRLDYMFSDAVNAMRVLCQ